MPFIQMVVDHVCEKPSLMDKVVHPITGNHGYLAQGTIWECDECGSKWYLRRGEIGNMIRWEPYVVSSVS